MPGQFARTTATAVALALVTARGADAQKGASARVCSNEPARSLVARLLGETAPHDRAGGLHLGQRGVGNGGCDTDGMGLEQPRFLDAPMRTDAPQSEVVTSVVTGAISNPIAGVAVATGAAVAWVAAGAGVTTSVASSAAATPAPAAEVGAASVIVNPEPGTIVLVASGLAVAAAVARRRAR